MGALEVEGKKQAPNLMAISSFHFQVNLNKQFQIG
jgi:hypothetical protein